MLRNRTHDVAFGENAGEPPARAADDDRADLVRASSLAADCNRRGLDVDDVAALRPAGCP